MIAGVFKNRNRNQIKVSTSLRMVSKLFLQNKYLREEKLQPEKVNSAFKQINNTKSFKDIFEKYGKIKKAQARQQIKPIVQESQEITPENNLLFPISRSQPPQPIKIEEPITTTDIQIRDRNASGSFHSTSSLDSVDRVNYFFPKKKFLIS